LTVIIFVHIFSS